MADPKGDYKVERLENGLYLARNLKQPEGLFTVPKPWIFYANSGQVKTGGHIKNKQRRPENSLLVYVLHDENAPLYNVASVIGLYDHDTGAVDKIVDESSREFISVLIADKHLNSIVRFAPWRFDPKIASELEGLEASLTGMKMQNAMKIIREKAGLVQGPR